MKKKKSIAFTLVFILLLGGLAYAGISLTDYPSPYDGRSYSHKSLVKLYTDDGVNTNRYIGELYCPAFVVEGEINSGWTAISNEDIPSSSVLYTDYFGLVNWPQKDGYYIASGEGSWGKSVNYLDIGESRWVPNVLQRHKVAISNADNDSYCKGRAKPIPVSPGKPKIIYQAADRNDPADIISDGVNYYYILGNVDGEQAGYRDFKDGGDGIKSLIDGKEGGGYAHFKLKFDLNLQITNGRATPSGNQLICSAQFGRPNMPYIPDHAKTTLRAYLQEEGGTPRLVKETILNTYDLDLGEYGDSGRNINTWNFTVNEAPKKNATMFFTINKRYENGQWVDEKLFLKVRPEGGNLVDSCISEYKNGTKEKTYDDNIDAVKLNVENQPEDPNDIIIEDQKVNLKAISVQVLKDGQPVTEIEEKGIYTIKADYEIGNIKKPCGAEIRWYVIDGDKFSMKSLQYVFIEPNKPLSYGNWTWDGSEAVESGQVDIVATINVTDVSGKWRGLVNENIGEEITYEDNITPRITISYKEERPVTPPPDYTIGGYKGGQGQLGKVTVTWEKVNLPQQKGESLQEWKVISILVPVDKEHWVPWEPPSRAGGYETYETRSAKGLYLKTEDINGTTVQGVWIQAMINGKQEEVFAECDDNGTFTGVGYIQNTSYEVITTGDDEVKEVKPKKPLKWRSLSGRFSGGIYGEWDNDTKRKKTWVNLSKDDKTIAVEITNLNQFPTTSDIKIDNYGNKLSTVAEFGAGKTLYVKADDFIDPGDDWQHILVMANVTGFSIPGGPSWMHDVRTANGEGFHRKGTPSWLNPFECHSEEEGYFEVPRYVEPDMEKVYEVSGPAPYTSSDYDHYLKEIKDGPFIVSKVAFKNYYMPGIFLKPCFVPKYKFVPVGNNPNVGTIEETGAEPGFALVKGDIPPPGSAVLKDNGDLVFTNNTSWPEDVEITVRAAYTVKDMRNDRALPDESGQPREQTKTYEQNFTKTVPAGGTMTVGNIAPMIDWVDKNYRGVGGKEKTDRSANSYTEVTGPLDIRVTFNKISVKVAPDYVGAIPIAPAPRLHSLGCKAGNDVYSGFGDNNVAFPMEKVRELLDRREFQFSGAFCNIKTAYKAAEFSKFDKNNLSEALLPKDLSLVYSLSY